MLGFWSLFGILCVKLYNIVGMLRHLQPNRYYLIGFKRNLILNEVKAMAAPNSAPVALGDVLNVTIDTAGPHGQGIVHLENFIIFVQNCPPGAKAKVKITHLGRTYANAQRVG